MQLVVPAVGILAVKPFVDYLLRLLAVRVRTDLPEIQFAVVRPRRFRILPEFVPYSGVKNSGVRPVPFYVPGRPQVRRRIDVLPKLPVPRLVDYLQASAVRIVMVSAVRDERVVFHCKVRVNGIRGELRRKGGSQYQQFFHLRASCICLSILSNPVSARRRISFSYMHSGRCPKIGKQIMPMIE